MIDLLVAIIVYSGFSATSFLILTKYRVIEYLQKESRFGIYKVVNCLLCTCFWLCLFYSLIGLIFGMDIITLLAPFGGAALTRAIIG